MAASHDRPANRGASGVFVLDVDVKNGIDGEASLAKLEAEHGPLPATRTAKTRSGGRHIYFRHVPGLKSSAGKIGAGLDIRTTGGYVIAPPSPSYSWVDPDAPIADAPGWLIGLLLGKPKNGTTVPLPMPRQPAAGGGTRYGLKALDGIVNEMMAAPVGERNDVLNTLSFRLGQLVGGGELAESAGDILKDAALSAALPAGEVSATFASGFKAGMEHPATAPPSTDAGAPKQSSTPHPSKKTRGFALTRLAEISSGATDWLVDSIVETASLALIFGDSGSGKSFIAVDLACSIATGTPWHGRAVKKGAVIYLCGEGQRGLKRRFVAWGLHHGIDIEAAPVFVSNMAGRFNEKDIVEVVAAIDAIVAEQGAPPSLLIADTVSRSFVGNENDTADMTAFIRVADDLKTRFQSAVLLIHHTGHQNKDRSRGAYCLTCALDFEHALERGADGVIRLTCKKSKDHETPPPMAFWLRGIELPDLAEGDIPVTSAVLEAADYAPPARPSAAGRGKNQTVALSALRGLFEKYRSNLESDGRDPAGVRVSVEDWRQACILEMPANRFREARRSLEDAAAVRIENGFVHLC